MHILVRLGLALALCLAGRRGDAEEPITGEPAAARRVRSVAFEGRRHSSDEALLEAAGLNPGAPWREGDELEVARRLARWPYLARLATTRVTPAGEGEVDVVIALDELPITGRISFSGNDALDDARLLEVSGLKRGAALLPGAEQEAREAILGAYHEDGFLLAAVDAELTAGAGGRQDVDFRIVEGRRVAVESVELAGAAALPAGEALSELVTQPRRFFGLVSRGYYIPREAAADVTRLRDLYRARGFLAAETSIDAVDIDVRQRAARVRFRVVEGPRYSIAGVRVEGQQLFPVSLLLRQADVATGVPYAEEDVEEGHRRLLRWYEAHADIVPRIDRYLVYGETSVTVVFSIVEEEHYTVGQVRIAGNDRTRDRVVRRDVTLLPGRPFTTLELERTVKRLQDRGLFQGVEVGAPPATAEGVRDLTLEIKEQERWGLLQAGGGASSGAGEVAYFSIHHSNFDLFRLPNSWNDWRGAFTGGGQELDVEIIPGTRESEYRFRFVEPYFFRSDLALMLGGGPSIYDRHTYEESRLEGSLAIRKYFDADHRFSLGAGYVGGLVRIDDLENDAPPDAVAVEGRTVLSFPRLDLRYDGQERNYFRGPTGAMASLRLDLPDDALGSDVSFTRVVASADYAIGLFDRRPDHQHLLHISVDAAWMEGRDGDDVPLFERQYLGGPYSFPGFEYRRLGPHQGKTPVGGEAAIWGAVDYSFPLGWKQVRAFGIFEWGDIEPELDDIAANRFRTAIGGGLMFRLRIGQQSIPANLYWVVPLAREAEDEEQLFSFSMSLRL